MVTSGIPVKQKLEVLAFLIPALLVAGLCSCSRDQADETAPMPLDTPDAKKPHDKAEAKATRNIPEEVPRPRGLKVLREETMDPSGKLVIYAVTRKDIVNQVIPYLEYMAASRNAKEALIYLFDRDEEEAGVPLEPVDYFRFFLGQVKIKEGRGVFLENQDYFKDDGDPTPNGDELKLAIAIWKWRKEHSMTELGREKEAAQAMAREKGLDPEATWTTYAKVLDDSISLGRNHFLKQGESGKGKH